jgi:3-deoxy-D-manno-octulosonic-acid transferase
MVAHVAALVVIPVILWKSAFSDRHYLSFLGVFRPDSKPARTGRSIWIHASSVGEVRASMILMDRIRGRDPDARIVLTLFTPRGMKVAREELPTETEVYYLPIDIPMVVRRAYRFLNPGVLIITETELWPCLIGEAFRLRLPVMMLNARLSDVRIGRYYALRSLFGPIVRRITYIHAQSSTDARRFLMLGAREGAVHPGGNIKAAGMLSNAQDFDRRALLEELKLPDNVRILVCGSTRDGEERIILDAFGGIRSQYPDLRVLLAPRHTDRVGEVERLVCKYGFACVRRSAVGLDAQPQWEVMILDTMGELRRMYGIGVCAFVGGSLVPVGGHNPLEPIALGVPTCFGPHMENAKQLADKCVRERLAWVVNDAASLAEFIRRCLDERVKIRPVGEAVSLFNADIDRVTQKVLSLWGRVNA